MTDRPILFRDDMVAAILARRKTVTRRPAEDQSGVCKLCSPGDRLWVRESFSAHAADGGTAPVIDQATYVVYRDGAQLYRDGVYCAPLREYADGAFAHMRWRPSIHMPRWACRLLLPVLSVKVSHVDEIDSDEAAREGFSSVETCRAALAGLYPGRDWFWRVEFDVETSR
jgi:uncharacterized protein YqfB (UPF0267 family)